MISPGERTRRLKRRLVVAAVLLVGAFLVVRFGLMGLVDLRRSQEQRLKELGEETARARRMILATPHIVSQAASNCTVLAVATNRYVLRQVLGSYPVQSEIHRLAAPAGFKVEYIREIGRQPTPTPPPPESAAKGNSARRPGAGAKKKPGAAKPRTEERPAFARYVVEIGGSSSYAGVVDLLGRIEQENPFVGVLDLSIRGVPQTPERHRVVMRLEWPVDADAPPPGVASVMGGKSR